MIQFITVSGRVLDLERPRAEDIDVGDVACGLSRTCRYYGQVRQFYSVAQHCLLVEQAADDDLKMAALLHDASEAYLGDVSRHLKHSEYLRGYRVIEERWVDTVNRRFRLDLSEDQVHRIKLADDLVAVVERTVLRRGEPFVRDRDVPEAVLDRWVRQDLEELLALAERLPDKILALSRLDPTAAEEQFLARFYRLRERV